MKTRNHRKTSSKTLKQSGGGVLSKLKKNVRNINLNEYLTVPPIEVLPQKNQIAYYTIRRKLEDHRKELAELEAYRESSTVASRDANTREEKKARLRSEINSLQQKLNKYTRPKNVEGSIEFSSYPAEKLGTITAKLYTYNPQTNEHKFLREEVRPVQHFRFKISPEFGHVTPFGSSGQQYSPTEKEFMEKIFRLRREAFPEKYGETSEEFNELLLSVFGTGSMSSEIVNGKRKSTVNPYINAEHLLFIPPMHCEAKPGTFANQNFVDTLYFYLEDDLKRMKNNTRLHYRFKAPPQVISSCAYTFCKLPSGLTVVELVAVATFEQYQGQGFAGKLLMKVFNYLSTIGSANIKITQGQVSAESKNSVDYIWLYYDRTKPYLGKFYKQLGFKELTENETDPELKEIYIGRKFLIEKAKKNKEEKWKAEAIAEKRKFSGEPLEFVDENKYFDWKEKKREYLFKTYGQMKNPDGSPIPDYFSKKTMLDFRDKKREKWHLNELKRKQNAARSEDEKDEIYQNWLLEAEKYKDEVKDKYTRAIFDAWIQLKVYKPLIINDIIKNSLNELTEEEEYEALEFERENVQMVLSMADWVYEMNKLTKL